MFGKQINTTDGSLEIEIAPEQLVIDGHIVDNPTREQYIEAGYREIIDNPPEDVPSGYISIQTGYDETDQQLIAKYDIIKIPKQIRQFSKYKIIEHAMKMGIWAQMKTKLEESGLYDLFLAAQDFKEDNEFFQQGVELAKSTFGITQDQIDAILDECVVES